MKVAEEFRRKLRELKLDVIEEIQNNLSNGYIYRLPVSVKWDSDGKNEYYIMRVDQRCGYIEDGRGQDVGKTELFIDMPIDTLLDLLEAVENGKLVAEDQL